MTSRSIRAPPRGPRRGDLPACEAPPTAPAPRRIALRKRVARVSRGTSLAALRGVRISEPGVVAAVASFVLAATTACGMVLPPADYGPRDEFAATDADDDWPEIDTRNDVEAAPPPRAPIAEIAETEWNERFERSRRAKYDRAVALRDAADRCYRELRDPKSGGSAKLAQAICFGGFAPRTPASASARPVTRAPPEAVPLGPFDPTAARAALRSLRLQACAPEALGAFAEADVTFTATGRVDAVVVSLPEDAPLDERECVLRNASAARAPPFDGTTAHVRFAWYRGVSAGR